MQHANKPPRRLLLKLSGESFCEAGGSGIDPGRLTTIAGEIKAAAETGCGLAIVVGGGNMIRGAVLAARGDIHRATADHLGMLGTVMNALALAEKLSSLGTAARAWSAVGIAGIADRYERKAAAEELAAGGVVVLGGGTGNPFFTTDTCAALRAAELDCDLLVKASKVDGVYDRDPKQHADARRFETLTLGEALERELGVMDLTAMAMCRAHGLAVRVLDFGSPGQIARAARGEAVGTLVTP